MPPRSLMRPADHMNIKLCHFFFFFKIPSVHGAICVIALFYTDTYCPLRSKIFFNIFGTFFTFGQKQVRNTLHILRRSCTLNLDRELVSEAFLSWEVRSGAMLMRRLGWPQHSVVLLPGVRLISFAVHVHRCVQHHGLIVDQFQTRHGRHIATVSSSMNSLLSSARSSAGFAAVCMVRAFASKGIVSADNHLVRQLCC